MPNTDISIFTNQDNVKMVDRLKDVLLNAKFFDCLVGYFRITGFYLLKERLENVSEIRFLFGLNTDNLTINAFRQTIWDSNTYKITATLKDRIREEFNNSVDSIDVENGINTFIEWIKQGKIKIRVCSDKNVHAKVYIIRNNDQVAVSQYGHVITGSSNFSYNGLEKNIEFNVELKSRQDVEYSTNFFNALWNNSEDMTDQISEIIQKETWMNVSVTPYKMYLKTLYSYFEEEIGDDTINFQLPEDFLKLEYQEHAVIQAKKILEKHGGVFIADVVGLGKTYISAMLGKHLGAEKRKLFIVPPVVKEYWESVLEDFGYYKKDKVVSLGIIEEIAKWDDLNKFDYVFIDEAHRFRNVESKEFQYLKQICYGKGVILITATPQNNYITDIFNLISLFQDLNESSIIPGNPNLGAFFRDLNKKINFYKDKPEYSSVLNDALEQIRDKVLKNVMIRRTRTEIIKFYEDDLKKQNISFPTLKDPIRLTYVYNDKMDKSFNETIELLKRLKFARYTPLLYVTDKSLLGDRKSGQENIKGFIKALLIKRLESSIYAFFESVKRIRKSHHDYRILFEKDRILSRTNSKINRFDMEHLLTLDDAVFLDLIEKEELTQIPKEKLSNNYAFDLQSDIMIFDELYNIWSKFDILNDDAKYDILVEKIKQLKNQKNQKLIIFSEAKDTVLYLEKKLSTAFNGEVISFSGSDTSDTKNYIKQNFDPNAKKQTNEKNILITTDAMSEGINLHKANIIINYDLPWNPTRVMQRVGRINRIGSKFDSLFVYNFFPAANTRGHLSLEESIKIKIQMFHTMLGEDSKYLTTEEILTSQQFFNILIMKDFKFDEDNNDLNLNASKMQYLKIINDIRKNDCFLFEEIKNLPNKLRIGRKSNEKTSLVSFIKKGLIKEFFITDSYEAKELDFDTAIGLIKSEPDETKIDIPKNYYQYLNINKEGFKEKVNNYFNNGYKAAATPKNLKRINQYLLALRNLDISYESKETLTHVNEMINRGVLTNYVYKEILSCIAKLKSKSNHDVIVKCFKESIPKMYFKQRNQYKVNDISTEKEVVILSEYFVKGENNNEAK